MFVRTSIARCTPEFFLIVENDVMLLFTTSEL